MGVVTVEIISFLFVNKLLTKKKDSNLTTTKKKKKPQKWNVNFPPVNLNLGILSISRPGTIFSKSVFLINGLKHHFNLPVL